MVLFVIDLSSRRVEIAGVKPVPDGAWVRQIARNLTDDEVGFLNGKRYLIHDRDPLFTEKFRDTLESAGVETIKIAPKAPNQNSFAERFVRSVKLECLDKLMLTSQSQLEYTLDAYLEWYHHSRPHAGIGGRMIEPYPQDAEGEVVCMKRLGGLLKSYRRRRRKKAA